jgi:lantibiotic modifying enzyme
MNKGFMAYENETDSFSIGGMTIENRLDRISVYGSLDISKDKEGLENALKLKRIIDASIDALKRDKNLPNRIEIMRTDTVDNPF